MVENAEVFESKGSCDHNAVEFSVITQVQLRESVLDFRRAYSSGQVRIFTTGGNELTYFSDITAIQSKVIFVKRD